MGFYSFFKERNVDICNNMDEAKRHEVSQAQKDTLPCNLTGMCKVKQ